VGTLRHVHQGALPFDRTIKVSLTERLTKEQISARMPHNLKTLTRLAEENQRDFKRLLSRRVAGASGEDLVEKQNAETGLLPIVSDEEAEYGYLGEDRHMVQAFLDGRRPAENFDDGVAVAELLMAAYMSAEQERTIEFPPPGLREFVPAVARGTWNPRRSR